MQLKYARIENFKGVRHCEIDFTSPWPAEPRRLTCLIGDNGSGKTTVLQAIALTLSLATRRTRQPADFDWHGFLAERTSSLGRTLVDLVVILDDEEIKLTTELYRDWHDSLPSDWRQGRRFVEPTDHEEVTLRYESGKLTSPQGFGALCQLLGRYYIKMLAKTQPHTRDLFTKLGDVFWFDQHRNLGTAMTEHGEESDAEIKAREGWQVGVEQLREFLVGWWGYYTSHIPGKGKSYIKELEDHFAQLFPGTIFRGIAPRQGVTAPSAKDFYFLLERDSNLYDIAEMASGEQAVFPLLYEFVRLDIARSIVLIDELELHLHPPQQQALLRGLRRIGPDCQFIITTHSPFLTEAIPDDQEVRLEGGRRCL